MRSRLRTRYIPVLAIPLALPLAIGVYPVANQWWVVALLVALVLLAHGRAERRATTATIGAWAISLAVIFAYGSQLVIATVSNVISPPQWDFRAFWILARVAALDLNFYEPEPARLIAEAFQNTPDFLRELVFPYPPPTMLLLVPLGLFDINTASLIWGILQGIALVLDVWLLWRIFLRDNGLLGIALAASLLLLLRSTLLTVEYSQTNFFVLLSVLLLWRDRALPRAGLWLTLGAMVKPVVALLGAFIVIRRRWTALVVGLVTAFGLSVLTLFVFGLGTVGTYFLANPAANAPEWVYTQTINQSLLATILRVTGGDVTGGSPFMNPVFVIAALGIVGATAFVCSKRDVVSDELALSLLIPAALMLYPSSSTHYTVLLVVPVAYLFSRRRSLPHGRIFVLGLALSTYALAGGRLSFFAVALVWLFLTGVATRSIVEHARLKRQGMNGRLSPAELDRQIRAVLARY